MPLIVTTFPKSNCKYWGEDASPLLHHDEEPYRELWTGVWLPSSCDDAVTESGGDVTPFSLPSDEKQAEKDKPKTNFAAISLQVNFENLCEQFFIM